MPILKHLIRPSITLDRLKRKYRRSQGENGTTYLAKVSGSVYGTKLGYFWVHDPTGTVNEAPTTYGAPYQLPILPGAQIDPRPDLKVETIVQNGKRYVARMAFDELARMGYDPHQTNQLDPRLRYILIEHLSNLQSFPDGSGLTVRVMPAIYGKSDGDYAIYAGEKGIDLTSYIPSTDMQVIVCLWLDVTDNSITITDSTELSRDTNLKLDPTTSLTYINECAAAAPYGAIGVTSYILFDDTTTITVLNKFHDLRGIIGTRGSGAIGYPNPVTSALSIADGYTLLVYDDLAISAGGEIDIGEGSELIVLRGDVDRDSVVSKSADYTITSVDGTIKVDASGGPITITLPTSVGLTGKSYNIKAMDISGGNVTIATTSSQTIDGTTSATLTAQYENLTVQSDGANWISL